MPLDLTDDKSTLVQVMAWWRQAASHYLIQCWPRFMLPYGVTRPQWVKGTPRGPCCHMASVGHNDLINYGTSVPLCIPLRNICSLLKMDMAMHTSVCTEPWWVEIGCLLYMEIELGHMNFDIYHCTDSSGVDQAALRTLLSICPSAPTSKGLSGQMYDHRRSRWSIDHIKPWQTHKWPLNSREDYISSGPPHKPKWMTT